MRTIKRLIYFFLALTSTSLTAAAATPVKTHYCVNVDDYVMPTAQQITELNQLHASCVRFDLIQGVAQAQINAYRNSGFAVLGISPYVPRGVPINQALFNQDAEFVASVAPSLAGLELMNEPDNEGPLDQAQLSPAQYITYAQTIAAAARSANSGLFIMSGGTSGYDPSWLAETVPALKASDSIDCVAVHPYGVAANNFGSLWLKISAAYGLPVCESEVGNTSGNSINGNELATALQQSGGLVPVFVYFNLDELSGNSGTASAFSSVASQASLPVVNHSCALNRNSGHLSNSGFLTYAYCLMLNRQPDPNGQKFWLNQLNSGLSRAQLLESFFKTPEFQAEYSLGSMPNASFVTLMYELLLFRQPDGSGFAAWVGDLDNGASRLSVFSGFVTTPEFRNDNPINYAQLQNRT